jgi:hypothetical protein
MATIDLTDATVTIGGVDLGGFAGSIGFELDPWQEQALQSVYDLPDGTLPLHGFRWTSRGHASPGQYEAIMGMVEYWRHAKQRRVRRMHAAYGRRRGRGRW